MKERFNGGKIIIRWGKSLLDFCSLSDMHTHMHMYFLIQMRNGTFIDELTQSPKMMIAVPRLAAHPEATGQTF